MMGSLFILLISTLSAAPHPSVGSSIVNKPQNNIAMSQLGFKLGHIPSNWVYKSSSDLDSLSLEMGPADEVAKSVLTFRTEKVLPKTDLEKYVRQYLRDYNQYGFEVVGLQSYKTSTTPSVFVDLTQKNKQTKSRQVFFLKEEKIVLATCLDSFEHFEKTILVCNRILGGFQWR